VEEGGGRETATEIGRLDADAVSYNSGSFGDLYEALDRLVAELEGGRP
jgi:hypothetical protein